MLLPLLLEEWQFHSRNPNKSVSIHLTCHFGYFLHTSNAPKLPIIRVCENYYMDLMILDVSVINGRSLGRSSSIFCLPCFQSTVIFTIEYKHADSPKLLTMSSQIARSLKSFPKHYLKTALKKYSMIFITQITCWVSSN